MSFANDKLGNHTRYIGANAAVAARVARNGIQNVLLTDALAFLGSGERAERVVLIGEELPSTNYDSYVQPGDEYWYMPFSSNSPSDFVKYYRTANGWEKVVTSASADWFDLLTVTSITTTTNQTYTAAQLEGGLILRDPNGSNRTDGTPTAAQIVAAIDGAAVGSSIRFHVRNDSDGGETVTLNAGTGVTLSPTTITVQDGEAKELVAVCTNVTASTEAVTIYELGALGADAVHNANIADDAVSLEHLDSGITPSHIVAVCQQVTTAGGAANEDITVTGLLSTDLIQAIVKNNGTNNVTIHEYACLADGYLDTTFGADPSSDTVLVVTALRTVS